MEPKKQPGHDRSPASGFVLNKKSVMLFVLMAFISWSIHLLGQSVFPSANMVPFLARTFITLVVDIGIAALSLQLLRANGLPAHAMGLGTTRSMLSDILTGMAIGTAFMMITAVLMYIFVPYRFEHGATTGTVIYQQIAALAAGNFLEELLFRGFLFIVLCQVFGWRWGVVITSACFGLFHLQGTGLSMAGLKMVVTTACLGVIFALSFIITGSFWTAFATHVTANILLHVVSGLDGGNRAMFMPVFTLAWPKGHDPGLWILLCAAAILAGVLYRIALLNRPAN